MRWSAVPGRQDWILKYKELIYHVLTLLSPPACRLLNTLTLLPLGVYVSE
jgi:hypothetical protein